MSEELRKDLELIAGTAANLLRKLEHEPEYVRQFIKRTIGRLEEQHWQGADRQPTEWVDILEREGYVLKIAFVHGRRGERITGSDLVFELKDKKLIVIQAKRVGVDGRIHFNRLQLSTLVDFEESVNCSSPQIWQRLLFRSIFRRVCFYQMIMTTKNNLQYRMFHIKQVIGVLGSRKSVNQSEFINHGLTEDEFHDEFWKCTIGGPDMPEASKKDFMNLYCLVTNRAIVWLHLEERGLLRSI